MRKRLPPSKTMPSVDALSMRVAVEGVRGAAEDGPLADGAQHAPSSCDVASVSGEHMATGAASLARHLDLGFLHQVAWRLSAADIDGHALDGAGERERRCVRLGDGVALVAAALQALPEREEERHGARDLAFACVLAIEVEPRDAAGAERLRPRLLEPKAERASSRRHWLIGRNSLQ